MGSLKGGEVTVGYRYYMSLQIGVCRGPIDELVQINVGDVRAWPLPDGDPDTEKGVMLIAQGPGTTGVKLYENGSATGVSASLINTVRATAVTAINAGKLFGGDKKEGGVQGSLRVYMGAPGQTYPPNLKAALGGDVPDFRGVTTLFYDGMICALNPYPKSWKMRVRRVLNGWDGAVWQPDLAIIWLKNNTIKAMNPAHIIYEALTNRDWGRGFPRDVINDAAFTAVAQKLYDEKLGLCIRWNRQDELGDFIQEVVDHIGASLYLDRTTGLLTIDLLRGDYDPDTLPLFDYDTGLVEIEEDETNARDDLVNEVIINWHDPIKNEDRQSRLHNLASMQATGALKSTTTTYIGLPTPDLALRIGQRDLKANATALKRYKVILDRRAWQIIPGSVFRISAPDKNIANAILRAGKIKEGASPDGRITAEAVLDVFGLPSASFIEAVESQWEMPNRTPVVIDQRIVREATYRELVLSMSPSDLNLVDPTSGTIAVVGVKPTPLAQSYSINTKVGTESFKDRNNGSFVPAATLVAALPIYATTVSFSEGQDLGLVQANQMLQIDDEMCRLVDIQSEDGISGTMTLARGCVDTLPRSHALGAKVFFVDRAPSSDGREYANNEDVNVRLTTVTSTQELSISNAPNDVVTIRGRQGRPWPPANFKVNGVLYASLGDVSGNLVLTWVHRDRTLIQDQLVDHFEGSIGPEPGTTYRVKIFKAAGDSVPVRTADNISGTNWTYTLAMKATDGVGSDVIIELDSMRDGLASFFRYRFNAHYSA